MSEREPFERAEDLPEPERGDRSSSDAEPEYGDADAPEPELEPELEQRNKELREDLARLTQERDDAIQRVSELTATESEAGADPLGGTE